MNNSDLKPKSRGSLPWYLGAGIVGADIGTSVLYSTGILFPNVGYLAPLFILFVCILMWLFKRTYEEGLAMSPYNGGAYVMILRSLGRQPAVLAGALTCVSYLATAAVSALSGAYYLSSLWPHEFSTQSIVLLSFVPIILFGLLNIKGVKEPAKIVTGIAGFHFLLLMIIGVWGLIHLGLHWDAVDFGKMQKINLQGELTFALFLYGFASAFLGITGFESAAQIVEDLELPTIRTVSKLYKTVVILVSATAPLISFLCVLLLTEPEIMKNKEYLLSALGMKLGGRLLLTIIVIDATLTLFGAVNTAFVGFIGLATTMAKQGNLPQVLLKRLAHKYPKIQGYPLVSIFFMSIAMMMTIAVPGKVEILAEVYGMAFLGVMVSFALGVVLLRNRPLRKGTPKRFLSQWVIKNHQRVIPLSPLSSGLILFLAQFILIVGGPSEARGMLIQLLSLVILVMAFYRWGVLEQRLETHSDLRLGLGQFAQIGKIPDNLPRHVLCAGGTGARRLIHAAIHKLLAAQKKSPSAEPFELIIFHAEESKNEGFFIEMLKQVVSQQIAPIFSNDDMVLTVRTLPGSLAEGLITLKKSGDFQSILFGRGSDAQTAQKLAAVVEEEVEVKVSVI